MLDHRLDADRQLSGRVYAGWRDLFNRLAIPLAFQTAPTASGGIVDLDRAYSSGCPPGKGSCCGAWGWTMSA